MLNSTVIKYNYVGYHIWDVPKDFQADMGAKYSYAVSRAAPNSVSKSHRFSDTASLQPNSSPHQNIHLTLPPPSFGSKGRRTKSDLVSSGTECRGGIGYLPDHNVQLCPCGIKLEPSGVSE